MNKRFSQLMNSIHGQYEALIEMAPVQIEALPRDTVPGAVYVIYEGPRAMRAMYAGMTKQRIHERLRGHVGTAEDCPLAFRLARKAIERNHMPCRRRQTRAELLRRRDFTRAYTAAKQRIRKMAVRWVQERDLLTRTLLEIYVAVVLKTPYNDFDTRLVRTGRGRRPATF